MKKLYVRMSLKKSKREEKKMSKTTKVLIGIVFAAIIVIGTGYALTAIDMNITGSASATPTDDNFDVKFDVDHTIETEAKVTATDVDADYTDGYNATINVTNLQKTGDWATATYLIRNDSIATITGALSAEISGVDDKYTVTTFFGDETNPSDDIVLPGGTQTLTVRVTLDDISLKQEENTTPINIKLIATPTQE